MKIIKRMLAISMSVACLAMFAIPVFARASSQITAYEIDVVPGANCIWIDVSVTGNGVMDEIGCESIEVYEQSGSKWTLCESLDENDSGMTKSKTVKYINSIECNGEKGVEYKVVVTVFADDGSERDTRTRTFYVTGR